MLRTILFYPMWVDVGPVTPVMPIHIDIKHESSFTRKHYIIKEIMIIVIQST